MFEDLQMIVLIQKGWKTLTIWEFSSQNAHTLNRNRKNN